MLIKVRGRTVSLIDDDGEIVQVLGDDDQLTARISRLRRDDYVLLELGDWSYSVHGADDSRVLDRRRPAPAGPSSRDAGERRFAC